MKAESENNRYHNENLPSKEKPELLIDVLTLTGHPGTGKTAAIRSFSKHLAIPNTRVFQAGVEIRKLVRQDSGLEVLDFGLRDIETDKTVDYRMTEFMKNSTELGPVITEGRLAGWIAKGLVREAKQKRKRSLGVVSIFLEAEEEIRARRVLKRDGKKSPELTLEKVLSKIKSRADKDLQHWRKAYPELANIDPLDPKLVDINGQNIYDLVINTDHLRVNQVVGEIYSFLIEKGFVETEKAEGNEVLPTQGQIYPDA
ncbi:AAA family ATPase [Candidatus Roizmanbacteria bacterium]|nr:AAA family ATPase [Candidatus Roizmanbacteria bacterium]